MPQARAKAHWHCNFKFNNLKLNGAGPVQALRPGLAQPAGMGPSRPDSESGDARAASALLPGGRQGLQLHWRVAALPVAAG